MTEPAVKTSDPDNTHVQNVATRCYTLKTVGLGSMAADCLQQNLRFLLEKPYAADAKPSWNTHAAPEDLFH